MWLIDKLRATIHKACTAAIANTPHCSAAASQPAQRHLALWYRNLLDRGAPLPQLPDTGFSIFSQADEDGILLYLFSIIGTTNRIAVEICAGDGQECNTANLIVNHGWHALLIDGEAENVRKGREFYRHHPCTRIYPPFFVHAWITRENVNEIILQQGIKGTVDLLSIDLDGVDYWIWEAIDVITPRVVVIEYQDIIGPDKALTIPYQDDFDAFRYPTTNGMPNYCGASLPAMVKLAERKGYRLVGCNRYGFNAFFVKNPLGEREIPRVAIASCFSHTKVVRDRARRWATVKDLPWVEV